MNIHFLLEAAVALDEAEFCTFDPKGRAEIGALAEGVRKQLRKYGVFITEPPRNRAIELED